jgi:hypothetical protein
LRHATADGITRGHGWEPQQGGVQREPRDEAWNICRMGKKMLGKTWKKPSANGIKWGFNMILLGIDHWMC